MRVLVTGADGFVGPHLVRRLTQAGHEVVARGGPHAAEGALDIRDAAAVGALVKELAPEGVVHLAGWSSVGSSFDRPLDCFAANALGTAHLFEAVRVGAPRARLLSISSGEVYGPGQHARSEEDALLSVSPYAMSKQAAELIAGQYQRSFGVQAIVARAFNHVGPGQDQRFVVPSLLQQVIDVARGQREPVIDVGNLDPVRDFSSVADVVDAYCLLLLRGAVGQVYNVCSGRGRSIREVLEELLRLSGVRAEIRIDPARVRPADIPHLVGDPAKLFRLGWQPRHDPFSSLIPADLQPQPALGGANG
jgi:GDP-4-dehydro-6-deoxy-D-mannose reductase